MSRNTSPALPVIHTPPSIPGDAAEGRARQAGGQWIFDDRLEHRV